MSVPAYKRKLSSVEYISQAQQLLIMTIRNMKKIPKTYTFYGKIHAYDLSQEIVDNCIKANGTNLQNNYSKRREFLDNALLSLDCLSNHLQTLKLYAEIEQDKWVAWGLQIDTVRKLIKGVIASDNKRLGISL